MRYRLVYEDSEGNCKIIVPSASYQQRAESDMDCIGRLYSQAIEGTVEFIACTDDKIPKELIYRDAWKKGDKDGPIKIDLQKAIQIYRQRLKKACVKKIKQLDEELRAAEKRQNLPEQVAIKRTQEILATLHEMNMTHCKTVDDIKKSIPKELQDVWSDE